MKFMLNLVRAITRPLLSGEPYDAYSDTTLVSSLLLCGVSAQAKEWKSITIATEGSYKLWNLTLPGGKLAADDPAFADLLRSEAV